MTKYSIYIRVFPMKSFDSRLNWTVWYLFREANKEHDTRNFSNNIQIIRFINKKKMRKFRTYSSFIFLWNCLTQSWLKLLRIYWEKSLRNSMVNISPNIIRIICIINERKTKIKTICTKLLAWNCLTWRWLELLFRIYSGKIIEKSKNNIFFQYHLNYYNYKNKKEDKKLLSEFLLLWFNF